MNSDPPNYKSQIAAARKAKKKAWADQWRQFTIVVIAVVVLPVARRLDSLLARLEKFNAELALRISDPSRRDRAEKTVRLYRQRLLIVGAIVVAALVDYFVLLPNLSGNLAARLAQNDEPGWLATTVAAILYEITIVALLITFKVLSETKEAARDLDEAKSRDAYYGAWRRLGGAWVARGVYISAVSVAFFANLRAEQLIAQRDSAQAEAYKSIKSTSFDEPARSSEEAHPLASLAFSPQSGITLLLAGLHFGILFLPSGRARGSEIESRSCAELSRARDRLERKIAVSMGQFVSRLLLTRHDPECRRTVMDSLPERVRQALPFREADAVTVVTTEIVTEPKPRTRENGAHRRGGTDGSQAAPREPFHESTELNE